MPVTLASRVMLFPAGVPGPSAAVPRTRTRSPTTEVPVAATKMPSEVSGSASLSASCSCTKKPFRPPGPSKSPIDDALDRVLLARERSRRSVALNRGDERRGVTARPDRVRRGRAVVRQARRDRTQQEVDVVPVRVRAVRASREAVRGDIFQPVARPLGVGRARVPLVADRVDERAALSQSDGVGRTVLDQIGVRSDVEVAVRRRAGVRTDDVVVARGEHDCGKVERSGDDSQPPRAVDDLEREGVEVDRRRRHVLQLHELGRVGARLVVVELVDHDLARRQRAVVGDARSAGRRT